MKEFIKQTLDKYGINAIIGVIVAGILIWTIAHFSAAAGSKVSVLWGLVEYTKKPDIHSNVTTPLSLDESITNNEQPDGDSIGPTTLYVTHNVSQEIYKQTIESIRSKNSLRELTGTESNWPVSKLPKGTYFFIFYSSIYFNSGEASTKFNMLEGARYSFREGTHFEMHYYNNGTLAIVGFTSESDASRITTLNGKSKYQIILTPTPIREMSSLIILPINRLIQASARRLELDKSESIYAIDIILK